MHRDCEEIHEILTDLGAEYFHHEREPIYALAYCGIRVSAPTPRHEVRIRVETRYRTIYKGPCIDAALEAVETYEQQQREGVE